jgi:hypothetical protein
MTKPSNSSKPGKHWLARLITGSYGYNGENFFEFLILHEKTKRLIKKIKREMKRDGLM